MDTPKGGAQGQLDPKWLLTPGAADVAVFICEVP